MRRLSLTNREYKSISEAFLKKGKLYFACIDIPGMAYDDNLIV